MKNIFFAILICGAISTFMYVSKQPKSSSIGDKWDAKFLKDLSSDMNTKLPINIDQGTRLEKTESIGNTFIYYYTFTQDALADIDLTKVQNEFFPNVKNQVCTDEKSVEFLGHEVVIQFRYSDKNNEFVGELVVKSVDCPAQ